MLRERRTIVGGVSLLADERDRADEALSTERLDESPSAETGADDDDVVGVREHD